jgi:hypothetical protein
MSSINYSVNRLNTYPIPNEAKEKELNVIKNTLQNKYNINKIMKHPAPHKQKLNTVTCRPIARERATNTFP